MIDANGVKLALWNKLLASGVITASGLYSRHREYVQGEGRTAFDAVFSDEDRSEVVEGFRGIGIAVDAIERVLGFGSIITRFLIHGLEIPTHNSNSVVYAGGLANLIVTTFDKMIDDLGLSTSVLSRSYLSDLLNREATRGRDPMSVQIYSSASGAAAARLMSKMVSGYTEVIAANGDGDRIPLALQGLILRMYDAECKTLLDRPDESALRQKAALLFVVLACPAGLNTSSRNTPNRQLFGKRLRMAYQLGTCFGLIDDVVDIDDDLRAGRANRVVFASTRGNRAIMDIVDFVSETFSRSMNEWNCQVKRTNHAVRLNEALQASVIGWFGGATWQEQR